ncbi:DedA family protein [Micromonospora sp. NPDC050397]|uniref:DedA family protein n=1 Tax=Micromonospora sp. NPDC050397 TaxID=3364279 RepID=UPI00384F6E45
MEIFAVFVDWLTGLPTGWLYFTVFLVLSAEVAILPGMVLPAATTMLTVGFLARTGALEVVTALAVTSVAAMVGDQVAFLEGRLVGPRLRHSRFGRRIADHRWERAERLFTSRGGPAVLLGRWTPYVRTLVPRVAAVAGLPYRRFVLFDAAAVLVWVPGIFLMGYLAGASYLKMGGMVTTVAVVAVAAAAGVGAAAWLRRRRPGVGGRRAGKATRTDRDPATGCRAAVRDGRSPLRRLDRDPRRTHPVSRIVRPLRDRAHR